MHSIGRQGGLACPFAFSPNPLNIRHWNAPQKQPEHRTLYILGQDDARLPPYSLAKGAHLLASNRASTKGRTRA
jgi:hypothetical protein